MIRRLLIVATCLCVVGIFRTRAQAPVTDFSASVTAGCGPLTVLFKDLSTNGPLFWNWDFGDGQKASVQNPAITFQVPGVYDVTLTTLNRNGNSTLTKTGYITVYAFPKATFTSNLTLACAPATIQFVDQSTPGQGSVTSTTWDFGDGNTGSGPTPSHQYTQPGYYNVGLKVTNSLGCSNTNNTIRYLRIVDGIQPNFTWDQTSTACSAPFVLNFLNQTAGPGNLTFSWNLGSGASPAASSDTSPVNISYSAPGNYDVILQVQSSLGCSQSIQHTIPLNNSTALITSPDILCVNTPVVFTNGSTPKPLSSTWDFGDATTSTSNNPTKTYTALGSYTITLTNKYASCTSSTTKTVQVIAPVVPSFTSPGPTISCSAPFTVQFTNQTPPTGNKWLWDFGDGSTSTVQDPSHIYTTTGAFDVKLTVTNISGCSNTTTKTQFVTIQTPTIALNTNHTLGACIASTPNNNVITPSVDVTAIDGVQSYAWTATGADAPNTSNLANPSFTYSNPGLYSLSVIITTNGGCTQSATFSSAVSIGTPVMPVITTNTVPPNSVCGRNIVTFSDNIAPAIEYKWAWHFGDGTADTIVNTPSIDHSFNTPGPKSVQLTLNHQGCQQLTTIPFFVNPPIPGFSYLPNCTVDPFQVIFTDTSKLTPIAPLPAPPPTFQATWDFGDGTPLLVTIPGDQPHTYNPADRTILNNYNVKLTITDGTCTQTYTKTIALGPVPFSMTYPAKVCRGTNFNLMATTPFSTQIKFYQWQIDGIPITSFIPSPAINTDIKDNGSHIITLNIQDVNGCTYSKPFPILVTSPKANFTSPAGGCKDGPITFTDASTSYDIDPTNPNPGTPDPTNNLKTWSWNFGDQTSQDFNNAPFTHQYADTGFFIPTLTVTDNSGCTDTYPATLNPIHITSPIANFGGPDSFYCNKTLLIFKDSSIGVNLTNSWTYGDGSPSDNTGIHSFPDNQTYSVTLKVTDQYNCTNSTTKPVRIQRPIAAFDISDTTAICFPLQTKFIAHGQFYDSLYWNFGDGTTSTLPTTSHFYNTLDTFYVKLFLRGPGGCLDSATRRVLVLNPNTTTTFKFDPTTRCDSVPAQFDIIPPGYTSFMVIFGDQQSDSSQDPRPFHMYRKPNNYVPVLSLTDATGCIVSLNSPLGLVAVLGSTPFFALSTHAFCDSSIVNFTDFTYSNDGFVSETYDFADGSGAGPQATPPFNTPHFYNKPGTFLATLKVVTNSNCIETYTDTVHVWQTPHPVISVVSAFCTGLVEFAGSLTAPLVDPISWAWDFGNGQRSTLQDPSTNLSPGNYTVRLQASVAFGCKDTTSRSITIHPLPLIKGPHEINTPVGFPITIPFTYSNNVTTWVWTPSDHLDCTDCANPTATLIFSQRYQVTVTDSNNCMSSDTIRIKTICNDKNYFLPNTFSPNGDGVNDYFYPRGSNLYNIQSLRVFNRWGQMVYERRNFPANAATMGWDGNFNGQKAPMDAYVYIAEVICDNAQVVALHGDVTLVR